MMQQHLLAGITCAVATSYSSYATKETSGTDKASVLNSLHDGVSGHSTVGYSSVQLI